MPNLQLEDKDTADAIAKLNVVIESASVRQLVFCVTLNVIPVYLVQISDRPSCKVPVT